MMKQVVLLLFITMFIAFSAMLMFNSDREEEDFSVDSNTPEHQEVSSMDVRNVLVDLKNKDGDVVANVSLVETEGEGVNIMIKGENLPPGKLGFHIHEQASCIPPDFESAGGHFNPINNKHGFDHPEGPHAGDLRNILVSENGTVSTEVLAEMLTLEKGKENSLLKEGGTALIIHSGPDDYISQPAGNAGDRIACGVIE